MDAIVASTLTDLLQRYTTADDKRKLLECVQDQTAKQLLLLLEQKSSDSTLEKPLNGGGSTITTNPIADTGNKKKPVRVYIDGCFDIMHSGHYNAVRQAKELGDILVVGIHSDAEILNN